MEQSDRLKVAHKGRSFFGPPEYACQHCSAMFWFAERCRVAYAGSGKRVVYTLCYRGGRISGQRFVEPPEPLHDLLRFDGPPRSKKFLVKNRQYNCHFNFTSMGGKVTTNSGDSKGPAFFSVMGSVYHRIDTLLPNETPVDANVESDEPKFIQLYIYDTENEIDSRMRAVRGSGEQMEKDVDHAIL